FYGPGTKAPHLSFHLQSMVQHGDRIDQFPLVLHGPLPTHEPPPLADPLLPRPLRQQPRRDPDQSLPGTLDRLVLSRTTHNERDCSRARQGRGGTAPEPEAVPSDRLTVVSARHALEENKRPGHPLE